MGKKLTLEQIKFIEKQVNCGSKASEIAQLSGLGLRVVRKYVSVFKKVEMHFPPWAALSKGL
jgi:hypothetical protein